MAPATAASKKPAAKKDEADAPAPKRTVNRTSQKLTMSQTKVLEAQFDTRLKDVAALDGKLAEVEAKFGDNPESFVPTQVIAARVKLAEALVSVGEAKAEFEKIGEQYRTFFG